MGAWAGNFVRAITEADGVTLAGAFDAKGSAAIGRDAGELAGLAANGVVVVDDPATLLGKTDGLSISRFPAASVAFAELLAGRGLVHVIGTTGLSAEDNKLIAAAAQRSVVVKSGNMSMGVNLLAALVKQVAKTLDQDFDIEILEMHHNKKIDAPSGTALLLGEAAAAGRQVALAERSVRVRDGHTGARKLGDIGFATLRGGTVVGEHNVIFAGPAERIELAHKRGRPHDLRPRRRQGGEMGEGPEDGLYSMIDVLGL